jgi:hypothetical protein
MTFNLDTVIAESDLAPFPFELDGEARTLPHIQTLTTEQAVRVEMGNPIEVLQEIGGDELGTRLGKLPAFALNALLEAWLAHSGLQPGESSASTGS